ncbi:MAG: ATP synthase F1 subunit epsilon [Alphaproteobacteria bacterium]|nr:ATP synthase F1 subunit epsilon [Alphaproteobacteria bacterium]
MADKVTFELVSPERLLLATEADMVVVPGQEGDFGVLSGHQPVISMLRPGAVDIYEGERLVERIFVAGGFAEVSSDRLTVLVEEATAQKDVDQAALPRRIAELRERIEEAGEDEMLRQSLEARLAYLELMGESGQPH